MPQFLTETGRYKQYCAEVAQFVIRRDLPAAIACNTKLYLNPRFDSMDWVASLVSTMAKRLVKSEVISREVESTEKKNIELYCDAPKRPLDHLFKFLSHYIPWFENRVVYERVAVRDVVAVTNITQRVEEHYHLIPLEGNGYDMRFHLMAWDGDYYDGSPTEWNDLKAIRDFLDENGCSFGDPGWQAELFSIYRRYKINEQSSAFLSDGRLYE